VKVVRVVVTLAAEEREVEFKAVVRSEMGVMVGSWAEGRITPERA